MFVRKLAYRFSTIAKQIQNQRTDYSNITPKITQLTDRRLLHIPNHPLNIIKKKIENYFKNQPTTSAIPNLKPEYSIFDNLNPIVSIEKNFNSLLVPQNHVSRKKSDTYYVNKENVLRTHTSAHQVEKMSQNIKQFILFGDVYRRDQVDQFHYPAFHQMEAVRVFKPQHFMSTQQDIKITQTANDLKQTIEGLIKVLFGNVEMRWVDAYFPFTFPSFELQIFYEGKWLQMLGSGVIHPQILKKSGLNNGQVGWAAGLGIERFAMKLFEIPDVRLFWSQDERFINQFKQGQINKFKPFSKFPVCYKDISFWLNEKQFQQNDFHSLIRDIGGDLIEKVECIDTFEDKKKDKVSKCFRIHFRSLERTLVNSQIDKLQFQMRDQIREKLNVTLR